MWQESQKVVFQYWLNVNSWLDKAEEIETFYFCSHWRIFSDASFYLVNCNSENFIWKTMRRTNGNYFLTLAKEVFILTFSFFYLSKLDNRTKILLYSVQEDPNESWKTCFRIFWVGFSSVWFFSVVCKQF